MNRNVASHANPCVCAIPGQVRDVTNKTVVVSRWHLGTSDLRNKNVSLRIEKLYFRFQEDTTRDLHSFRMQIVLDETFSRVDLKHNVLKLFRWPQRCFWRKFQPL